MPMRGLSLVCGSNKVVTGVSVRMAASGLSACLLRSALCPPMGCRVAVSDLSAHSSAPLGVGEKPYNTLVLSLRHFGQRQPQVIR